jgi:hypothetical protein
LTVRVLTTTSHSSKEIGSPWWVMAMATLLSRPSKSSGASASCARSMSTSGVSGSRSTITPSAASTPWARVSATTATIASPTKRTTSVASTGLVMAWLTRANGAMGPRSMSAAVTTASTPGAASASLVSMLVIRAWATVERTNTTWAASAEGTSST